MFGSTRFGTFGVACAAYHFARGWRPSGLFERLAMRLGGQSRVFQLLFTDDLKMVGQAASADNYHVCLKFVGFFMAIVNLKWSFQSVAPIVQWAEEARQNEGWGSQELCGQCWRG